MHSSSNLLADGNIVSLVAPHLLVQVHVKMCGEKEEEQLHF